MIRKPDDVTWHGWPWKKTFWQHLVFGWDRQTYSYDAVCWSLFLGFVSLRWHYR